MSDDIADLRFWETSDAPGGVYPTLDQWAAAIAEVNRMEAEAEARTIKAAQLAQDYVQDTKRHVGAYAYSAYASSGAYSMEDVSSCAGMACSTMSLGHYAS